MNNFDLHVPTQLVFGKGEENRIGELLAPRYNKVLLHYGGGSVKKSGLYDRVTASLKSAGVEFVELGGVQPNPTLPLVYEGIELCRKEGVEAVLAVGGGSAIDSAKGIAIGVYHDGDVWEVYEKTLPIKDALPVATILTIPAAGSETSISTVLTNEDKKLKYGYNNPILRPVLSIMNPELFYTLPKNQISNGIMDMLSHILERYFTHATNVDLTDALCEATMRTIIKNGPIAYDNPNNYDAWAELGFAGSLAHNTLLGMGRVDDWASHRIEHELSAIYDVAHGAGLAVIFPAWMTYVYKENVPMFVQFARNVMGVDWSLREPEEVALEGIERFRAFLRRVGLPLTLTELGIDDKNLELMSRKATRIEFGEERLLGNFKKLNWEDVLKIYKLCA